MIPATVDTNILISGLVYRRGKPHDLLQQALTGEISLTISQPIVDEMADVLARKFGATLEEIAEVSGRSSLRQQKWSPRPWN